MIDYTKLGEHAQLMQDKALEMILDPKTKANESMGLILQMLEVSEHVTEIVDDRKDEGHSEIKDELMAGEAKFDLYVKTKDPRWLRAADVEADYAALYMEMYNDYGMKDWHTSLKAKIKAAMV